MLSYQSFMCITWGHRVSLIHIRESYLCQQGLIATSSSILLTLGLSLAMDCRSRFWVISSIQKPYKSDGKGTGIDFISIHRRWRNFCKPEKSENIKNLRKTLNFLKNYMKNKWNLKYKSPIPTWLSANKSIRCCYPNWNKTPNEFLCGKACRNWTFIF